MSTALLAAELRSLPVPPQTATAFDPAIAEDSAPPVFCVIGPSGTGKSALVNAIAGSAVAAEGVLRPTTRTAAVWGALPAGRLNDLDPLGGSVAYALVDGPPSDRFPSRTSELLASAHVAVVVTSRDRYADAATRALLEEVRACGLHTVIVVNRLDPATAEVVMKDATDLFDGWPLFAITEGDLSAGDVEVDRLRRHLEEAAEHAAELRAHRLHAAAVLLADDARSCAEFLRSAEAERTALEGRVRLVFREATTGIDGAADASTGSFADAESALLEVIERRASAALDAALATWPTDRAAPAPVGPAVLSTADSGAIHEWHAAVATLAFAASRPRWLGRTTAAHMEDEAWRVALDPAHRPRLLVRILLGGRLTSVRQNGATALDDSIARRIEARAEPLRGSLRHRDGPIPERLEALAAEVVTQCPDLELPIDPDAA